jgi:hypothetical protein
VRSRSLLALSLALGCSYDWSGLRPGPVVVADAPAVVDAVTTDVPVAPDVPAPQPDVIDAGDPVADVVDAATPPDVVDVTPGLDVVDVPPGVDVVDVPPGVDVVDVPPARDVVDVPPGVDVVDVPPARDVVDVPAVTDTGPACTGLSCPCAPGNVMGYCRVGEQCVSGACAAAAAAGALIITEVMNDTDAPINEPDGEWIEVYNPAAYAVDIRGMRVRDAAEAVAITTTGPALLVLPRAYAVIARTTNLGVSGGPALALATYPTIALNNSGIESITLATEANATIDTLSYGAGWPSASGRAKALRPGILDATMNDTGSNWCAAGTSYATMNFGTPGAPNSCM